MVPHSIFIKANTYCLSRHFKKGARMGFSNMWGLPSAARGGISLGHFIGLSPIKTIHLSDHVESRRYTFFSVEFQTLRSRVKIMKAIVCFLAVFGLAFADPTIYFKEEFSGTYNF